MAPRARLETRATVHVLNEQLVCRTCDVSTDGLAFLALEEPVPLGTVMRVHLKLPDARETLDLDGILVRTDPQSTGMVWGLKLLSCEADAQTRIARYVRARAPRPRDTVATSRPGDGFTSFGGHSSTAIGLPPGASAAMSEDEES